MSQNIFNQIWNMQHDLNMKIGKDTIHDKNKEEFLFMYCEALIDEIIELMECYELIFMSGNKYEIAELNYKNAKIEAIDSLHFLMSIFHILDVKMINDDSEDPFIYHHKLLETKENKKSHFIIYDYIVEYLKTINQIKNRTNWKWWSKTVKDDPTSQFKKIIKYDNIRSDLIQAFKILMKIFYHLKMTPENILDIYKQKCQINHNRQNENYDVSTKTEKDNKDLEKNI